MRERLQNNSKLAIARNVGLSTFVAVGLASEADIINEAEVAIVAAGIAEKSSNMIRVSKVFIDNFPAEKFIEELPKDLEEYDNVDLVHDTYDLVNGYIAYLPSLINDYTDRDGCQITTEEEIEHSEALVKSQSSEVSDIEIDDQIHNRAAEVAEKYGLTLADESSYYDFIEDAKSYEEVLFYLNHYGSNHSLSFSIPTSRSFSDFPINYEILDPNEFSLEDFKNSATQLVSDLYYVPTEITRFADTNNIDIVNEVVLTNFIEPYAEQKAFDVLARENGKSGPGGVINPATRNIYVGINNLNSVNFSRRLMHEISHAVVFNYCGVFDAIEDKEFSNTNPDDFKYSDNDSFNLFKNITSSKYGYTHVYEDQAYVMTDRILMRDNVPFNVLSDTERKKIELSFARLGSIAEHFEDYWFESREM